MRAARCARHCWPGAHRAAPPVATSVFTTTITRPPTWPGRWASCCTTARATSRQPRRVVAMPDGMIVGGDPPVGGDPLRIATWNVNSIRTRLDRVLDWLERAEVDVLAMQDTKCSDQQFPTLPFLVPGY